MSLVGDMLAGLVLERGGTGQRGGSGVANDWERIKKLQEKGAFNGLPPLIAAGGLDAVHVRGGSRGGRARPGDGPPLGVVRCLPRTGVEHDVLRTAA